MTALIPHSFPLPEGYETAKSTIEAFWHVVRNYDNAYLQRWLDEHPDDRTYLLDLWRRQ